MADVVSAMPLTQVETGRLRMAYRSSGNADGLAVVLLHGTFATSRWWEPLAAVMPGEFRLLAPDLRGCGATEHPDQGYEFESQAEDLAAFLAALEAPSPVLVAHSAVCAVTLEFVLSHPDLVERLILISPPPLDGVQTPPEGIAALEAMRTDRALLERGMTLLAPWTAGHAPEFFRGLVDDARQMASPAFSAAARSLGRWNRLADARALTLPTLVIWGDRDPIVDRASVMRLLISLPGAENLDIMHGVGHSPMLDDPLGLAERIVDFATEDDTDYAAVRSR